MAKIIKNIFNLTLPDEKPNHCSRIKHGNQTYSRIMD